MNYGAVSTEKGLVWIDFHGEGHTEVTYQVCSHCGFRLMHVLPPTRKTFPFPVVYCPICGLRQDETGFHPGASLSEEEKYDALRRWLQRQGLDEQTLVEHYHLSLDHFFEPLLGE